MRCRDAQPPAGRHDESNRMVMAMVGLVLALWLALCLVAQLAFRLAGVGR